MTNEIVWIFGSSGVGKETFVNYLVTTPSEEILTKLGWKSKKIVKCQESIEYVAQYDDDPKGEERENLLTIIPKYIEGDNTVVLVKGQDLDLIHNRLVTLKKTLPSCMHRIIFLHTTISEIFLRCQKKLWWEKYYTQKDIVDWLKPQIKYLLALKEEFLLDAFESKDINKYIPIAFPPILE